MLQRAKDPEEAIKEFRHFKGNDDQPEQDSNSEEEVEPRPKPISEHIRPTPQ